MGFGFTAAQLIAAPVGFFVGVGGTAVVSLLQSECRSRGFTHLCLIRRDPFPRMCTTWFSQRRKMIFLQLA